MYTDKDHIRIEDPGKIEGNIVFTYLDVFSNDEHFKKYLPEYKNLKELKDHYQRGGLGDVKIKKFLNEVLQETLLPIREKRKMLEKDIKEVFNILEKGCLKANKKANETLKEVQEAMGCC